MQSHGNFGLKFLLKFFVALNVPATLARKLRETLRPELPPLQNRNFKPNYYIIGEIISELTVLHKGDAKGDRSLFSVSVTFGNHFVTFMTFLVIFFANPLLPPPFCGRVRNNNVM